jgi:hypothetical protein
VPSLGDSWSQQEDYREVPANMIGRIRGQVGTWRLGTSNQEEFRLPLTQAGKPELAQRRVAGFRPC